MNQQQFNHQQAIVMRVQCIRARMTRLNEQRAGFGLHPLPLPDFHPRPEPAFDLARDYANVIGSMLNGDQHLLEQDWENIFTRYIPTIRDLEHYYAHG